LHFTPHKPLAFARGNALKEGIREMLLAQPRFTHFVTLNFHTLHPWDTAKRILQRWHMNVTARLFRSRSARESELSDLLFFAAFPETTKKGEPHYHALVRVAEGWQAYFERVAPVLWKNCVRSGTCHPLRIGPTEMDLATVVSYVTKESHLPWSQEGYVLSTTLKDGRKPNCPRSATFRRRGARHE
jgi:hypothetical protein